MDVAASARDAPADDITRTFLTPLVPIVPHQMNADDIWISQGSEMFRTRVIANKHCTKRKESVEIIKRYTFVYNLKAT